MKPNCFIAALFIVIVLHAPQLHAQRISNIYRFYNNLSTAETDCAEDLIPAQGLNVQCQPSTAATKGSFIYDTVFNNYRKVYHNNLNWGLKYLNSKGVVAKTYTVQMYIKATNFNKDYTRIIDFSNGVDDNGIYFTRIGSDGIRRCLNFYPSGNFGTCPFFNNYTYYLLTITRDSVSKNIDIYVNDQLFTSYYDAIDFYTSTKGKPVYIFRDDPVGYACEDGEANFAYLSFSNFHSSQEDVAYVYKNINAFANSADFSVTPSPVCIGSNATVVYTGNISTIPGQYTFNWTWDDANVTSGSDGGPYIVNWTTGGNKTIGLSITGGCANTSIENTKQVTVNTAPVVDLGNANVVCAGDSIILNPGAFDSYQWQDGTTNNTYAVKKGGLYSVTVTTACGTAKAHLQVTENSCAVYFPNVFTPNGDNNNDYFKILNATAVKQYKLAVFNRFGQLIFETADIAKGWDGTFNGQRQNPGTYIWYSTFTLFNVVHQQKGTVVLIR